MIGKLFKRGLKPKFTTELVNRGGKSCRVNIKKDGIRYGYAELYLWDEEVDVVKFENVIKLAIK